MSSGKHFRESSFRDPPQNVSSSMLSSPSPFLNLLIYMVTKPSYCITRVVMADEGNEFERPRKIPKTLKEKDSGKRLIVILENASLETVKARTEY